MIEIRNLFVELGVFALRDISLSVRAGEYFIILGPTGAGKTILLESIAGVQPIQGGEIWLDGVNVTELVPEQRRASIVYQDHMLFPHFTVQENIIFGLKTRREKPGPIVAALNQVVSLLRIEHLLQRKPDTLSGGEKQKVALARAIIINPEVLLLDEPLASLDPQSRENVQQEIIKLQRELGITVLHVTHDFEEAITMGDRIAVVGAGTIRQVGTPEEIFRHPNSEFVARFTLAGNILAGTAMKEKDGKTVFVVDGARILTDAYMEGPCHAAIRPEDIVVSNPIEDASVEDGHNHFDAVITQVINKGSIVYVTTDLSCPLKCLLTSHAYREMNLGIGQEVNLTFAASSVHLFRG